MYTPVTIISYCCRNPSECDVNTVVISTQTWGNEVTWTLGDCSGGPYTNYHVAEEDCCLTYGTSYDLVCMDSASDGWHGGSITIDEISYCGDFSSGSSQSETVVISGGGNEPEPEPDSNSGVVLLYFLLYNDFLEYL